MAAITLQRLKQVIADAYANGYHGCLDLSDTYVEEAIARLMDTPAIPVLSVNDGWKNWTVKELRSLDVGTIMEHATRGKGWTSGTSSERLMIWADGSQSHFYKDETPWNEPMRVIGKMKVDKGKPPKTTSRNLSGFQPIGGRY